MAVKFKLMGCVLGLLMLGASAHASTPDDVERNLSQVSQLIAEGKVEDAHKKLVTALKANPSQIPYHMSYIELMIQVGQREAVEESYAKLAKSNPKDSGLIFLHAQTLEDRKSRYERFAQAQKVDPKSPWPYLGLASVEVMEGRGNEAILLLEQSLLLNPTLEPALEMLAMLLATKGEVNKSIVINKRLMTQDKSNARGAMALGRLYMGINDVDNAIGAFEAGIAIEPNNGTGWANLGHLYFSSGRYDEALNAYQTVGTLVENDENSRVMASICQRIIDGSLPKKAVDDVMVARQIEPNSPEEALKLYQKAVVAAPDFELAHLGLGRIYLVQEKLDLGAVSLNKALELNPKLSETRIAYAQLMFASGFFEQAESHLRAAAKFQPNDPSLYLELGQLYTYMRIPQGAEYAYTRALPYLSGEDAFATQVNLAGAIAAQGRLDEAVQILESIVGLKPDNASVWSALGDLYAEQERFKKSRAAYQSVLKVDKNHETTKAQLKELDKLEAAYKENMANKRRASQILVKDEAEAKKLFQALKKGADFALLARANSEGPEAIDGGDLGFFGPGELAPDLEGVLSKLKVGDYSSVIKTANGYHILMRTH